MISTGENARAAHALFSDSLIKELRHHFQSLLRFRQLKVIPERMRKRLEDYKLGIHSGLQKCHMKYGCIA